MSPFTSEESITSSYVKNEHPDAIINIVDATNLSRSLFFTTQLLELGIPLVVALNKATSTAKRKRKSMWKPCRSRLGCPVVEHRLHHRRRPFGFVTVAASLAGKKQKAPYFQGNVDLTDKHAVEQADRQRFAFVNALSRTWRPARS